MATLWFPTDGLGVLAGRAGLNGLSLSTSPKISLHSHRMRIKPADGLIMRRLTVGFVPLAAIAKALMRKLAIKSSLRCGASARRLF